MDIHIYTSAYICTCTYMYIYMHMHTCIYISPQLVHARLWNSAAASLPWKLLQTYLESCANIVQAVVSARPPAPRRAGRPPTGRFLEKFAKKSVQIHASPWSGRCCSVAQTSSDHPRWCGPHPFCLWFTLAHGRGSHPQQKSIFTAIFAGFLIVSCYRSLPQPQRGRMTLKMARWNWWRSWAQQLPLAKWCNAPRQKRTPKLNTQTIKAEHAYLRARVLGWQR